MSHVLEKTNGAIAPAQWCFACDANATIKCTTCDLTWCRECAACKECGVETCPDPSCYACDETICSKCANTCEGCKKVLCSSMDCRTKCSECPKVYCDDCRCEKFLCSGVVIDQYCDSCIYGHQCDNQMCSKDIGFQYGLCDRCYKNEERRAQRFTRPLQETIDKLREELAEAKSEIQNLLPIEMFQTEKDCSI
jgi:hypothetical protein